MTLHETTMTEAREAIYVRGWHHGEGMAMVDRTKASPIHVVMADRVPNVLCHGFFHIFEGRLPSAVFVQDDSMFLQIEEQRWEWVRDRVKIKLYQRCWGTMRNSVRVYAGGRCGFKHVYTSSMLESMRLGDMTVDAIDEETSDWWVWLSRVVAQPKNRPHLIARWHDGV
jgi:hypothetical protein